MSSWSELASRIESCTLCPELVASRTRVVVGQWPVGARVLLVGEAPGAEEDLAGEPFVGRAGVLLDGLLAEVGLARSAVAVLNVLRCRPPGNRRPAPTEVVSCASWLDQQRALIAPQITVALGLTATTALLGKVKTLAGARGQVHPGNVIATYHPSAALRFGPRGAPIAALREDLARVARMVVA
jgi:uracil-DNA glycosylase family 4